MDNHRRRVNYAVQRYGWLPNEASAVVSDAYAGDADLLLTPAQRRRVRHKRGTSVRFGGYTSPQQVTEDELKDFTFAAPEVMRRMYAVLPGRGQIRLAQGGRGTGRTAAARAAKQGETAPGTR
jgi:hypothetical protein